MLSIYYNFKISSQPFLNAQGLPAMSSQIATYARMASPYLTHVVNFNVCSFGHFIWTCSTLLFYRRTLKKFLTVSSATHKPLSFATHTDNIACWVTCWSLSIWSFQCSLWSLSLCSLMPLCSGNERPQSSYSLTSKRCSSQSLLSFQHSVVPKILQWMSTAIKPLPSWHPRCFSLSPKLPQNFHSHSIIFTATLQTCQHIYNAI